MIAQKEKKPAQMELYRLHGKCHYKIYLIIPQRGRNVNMQNMTHPDILTAERFGSRTDSQSYRCICCDREINDEGVYMDLFGRSFCGKKCRDIYYGRKDVFL